MGADLRYRGLGPRRDTITVPIPCERDASGRREPLVGCHIIGCVWGWARIGSVYACLVGCMLVNKRACLWASERLVCESFWGPVGKDCLGYGVFFAEAFPALFGVELGGVDCINGFDVESVSA